MATNYQALVGQTVGLIGECVYYVRNSKNIARRKAINPNNPRTIRQQNNRKNIALLVKFFQQLKPVLYRTLNNRPENRAVYHHFLSINLSVSVSFGVFYPEFFILSGTGLDYTSFQVSRNELEGNKFQASWEPFSYGNQSGDEQLQAVLFSKTKSSFDFALTSVLRCSGSCELLFNEEYKKDECFIYLCFVKQDITMSSQSSVHAFAAIS
jgi:hypothetical protein